MDIPIKFIIGYAIVFLITYSVSGIIYDVEYDQLQSFGDTSDYDKIEPVNATDEIENQDGLWEQITSGLGTLWEGMVKGLKILTFQIPNIPTGIMVFLNLVFQPLNFALLLGLYPYIKDLVTAIAHLINAIIPF
jgi:hypothetical protein